jgi:predicted RNA-binding Zn-ribbon protein involved in translation (DUF1610 family)
MIIEPKKTFIAYRCPACGQAVKGLVGSFSMKADMLRLKCPCGESHMTVTVTPEKKLRLAVPCMFCAKDHSYILSQEIFFGKELFLLNCAYTGLDIAFLGEEAKVEEAIRENDKALEKLFSEMGLVSPQELYRRQRTPEEELPDAQIYDIVRFVVRELEADGAIDCPCHGGQYDFEVVENGIRVYCPDCDAEYIFPADSVAAAQEFLHCDSLKLE